MAFPEVFDMVYAIMHDLQIMLEKLYISQC